MIYRDLELAEKYDAPIDIQHISTKEGVELLRQKKYDIIRNKKLFNLSSASTGFDSTIPESKSSDLSISDPTISMEMSWKINIHGEATPHHFSLTEDDLIKQGTLAKMNPPLRTEQDRLAIIQGLKDNSIDLIATDHAPHSSEEKSKPITEAPSGIIGLETALSLGITNLVKPGYLTYMELLEKMTINPSMMYHLDKGYIDEGGPADLVIFNDKEYDYNISLSKSSNSPFLGKKLFGEILYTICNGNIVYKK